MIDRNALAERAQQSLAAEIGKLTMQFHEANAAAELLQVEIGRRDARIEDLERQVAALTAATEPPAA